MTQYDNLNKKSPSSQLNKSKTQIKKVLSNFKSFIKCESIKSIKNSTV